MKKRDNNKVVMVLDRDLEYPVLDRRVFKEALSLKNNGYNVIYNKAGVYKNE